jgi:hypothetical protein
VLRIRGGAAGFSCGQNIFARRLWRWLADFVTYSLEVLQNMPVNLYTLNFAKEEDFLPGMLFEKTVLRRRLRLYAAPSCQDSVMILASCQGKKMQPNIDDFLAYEIKKELADRYFGFRRMIEEDKLDLAEKIKRHSQILEKRICFELIRIYILLHAKELIHEFTTLIGWQEILYYDPYLTESPTIRERVFQGIKKRGLIRSSRFKNLAWDSYQRLEIHVAQYRDEWQVLFESQEVINEEIKLFYSKNDINSMMGFLRNLGGSSPTSGLPGAIETGLHNSFGEKMRVEPVPPIELQLPRIPPILALPAIRPKLKKILDKAYRLHDHQFLDIMVS